MSDFQVVKEGLMPMATGTDRAEARDALARLKAAFGRLTNRVVSLEVRIQDVRTAYEDSEMGNFDDALEKMFAELDES